MGEFTQMIPGQIPGRDVLKLAEVARYDVQESEFRSGVDMVWVLDDRVEKDKERR